VAPRPGEEGEGRGSAAARGGGAGGGRAQVGGELLRWVVFAAFSPGGGPAPSQI
jgi:hypothetical protein